MMKFRKASNALVLALLLGPAMALAADPPVEPKGMENMPISKFWRPGYLLGPRTMQKRVPRIPARASIAKIDVNSCTLEQLQNLPGVGASLGAHLMAGRPYRDFDDLVRDGVPLSTVEQLRTRVSFGP